MSYVPFTSPTCFKVDGEKESPAGYGDPKNLLSVQPRTKQRGKFEDIGAGENREGGPIHDNDHADIQAMSVLPTTDEILCRGKTYLPPYNKWAWGHLEYGVPRYLDKMFRQLRYDHVTSVIEVFDDAARVAVSTSLNMEDYRKETATGVRYNLFTEAAFEKDSFADRRGAAFEISFSCPHSLRASKTSKSTIFEEGMLCGLVAVHTVTKQINTIFFDVHARSSTYAMESRTGDHSRASLKVTVADPNDTKKVMESAAYTLGLQKGVKLFLIDVPSILTISFRLHLERLQQLAMKPDFAFKEILAPNTLDSVMPKAPELGKDFVWNMNSLKKDSSDKEPFSMKPRQIDPSTPLQSSIRSDADLEVLKQLSERTTLDEGQVRAMFEALNRNFSIVQGPPGTGKSHLGKELIKVILGSRVKNDTSPIILVCQTNHALDDMLEAIIAAGIKKVVRLGSRSSSDIVKSYTLRSLRSKTKRSCRDASRAGAAKVLERSTYTEGIEFAEALKAGPTPKWALIKDFLEEHHIDIYEHFIEIEKLNPGVSDLRRVRRSGFAFQYWLEGGDLNDCEGLQAKFADMLASCDLDDVSSETVARIKTFAIESIKRNVNNIKKSTTSAKLWELHIQARECLAKEWMVSIDPWKLCASFGKMHSDYQSAIQQQKTSYAEADKSSIEQAETEVIGLTSTGFAQNWDLIASLNPKTIIFEEASELVEAHSVVCMVPSLKHCIKIGDPKQLRPHVSQMILSKENSNKYKYDESLFERLMEAEMFPCSVLNTQRRAHPVMADLLRIGDYPFLKDHPSTLSRPVVAGVKERMFWLNHMQPEDIKDQRSALAKSPSNSYEADFVSEFVKYLVLTQGYKFGEITILTPYKGQIAELMARLKGICRISLTDADREALMAANHIPDDDTQSSGKTAVALSSMLRISTVDNYQGEQAKVIIFSAVRSNEKNTAGFLKNRNRINVSVSRAEDGFYVVGNAALISKVEYWGHLVEHFEKQKLISPIFQTTCPRHPEVGVDVEKPKDFRKARTCTLTCTEELPCGHVCTEPCHPVEMHQDGRMTCTKPCAKILTCGHQCEKTCDRPCGVCKVSLPIQVGKFCQHPFQPTCGDDVENRVCRESLGNVTLQCGHDIPMLCFEQSSGTMGKCTTTCGDKLTCGHKCSGNCTECKEGAHRPCESACKKRLDCGHECTVTCHKGPCPPCNQICTKFCDHRACSHPCSEPCDPCTALAEPPSCPHHGTTSKPIICCLPSDIIPCSEPCGKVLDCEVHLCPGLCGERCPPAPCVQCRSMLAVRLPLLSLDCNHEFNVNEIDEKVRLKKIFAITDEGCINKPHLRGLSHSGTFDCPTCSAPTPRTRRFELGNSIDKLDSTIDSIYIKIGRFMTQEMERMRLAELHVGNRVQGCLDDIKNGPLAGLYNQEKIMQRGLMVKEVQNDVINFRDRVVTPAEDSIIRITRCLNNRSLFPVPVLSFKARLDLIIVRGRMVMIDFGLKVIEHLQQLSEQDKHTEALLHGLTTQTVGDCAKSIDAINSRIIDCHKKRLPRLELEYRIVQVGLWTVLRALKAEKTTDMDPKACLEKCQELMNTWPEISKLMSRPYRVVQDAFEKHKTPDKLVELYRGSEDDGDDLWHLWAKHKEDTTVVCSKKHLYSEDLFAACPECGESRGEYVVSDNSDKGSSSNASGKGLSPNLSDRESSDASDKSMSSPACDGSDQEEKHDGKNKKEATVVPLANSLAGFVRASQNPSMVSGAYVSDKSKFSKVSNKNKSSNASNKGTSPHVSDKGTSSNTSNKSTSSPASDDSNQKQVHNEKIKKEATVVPLANNLAGFVRASQMPGMLSHAYGKKTSVSKSYWKNTVITK